MNDQVEGLLRAILSGQLPQDLELAEDVLIAALASLRAGEEIRATKEVIYFALGTLSQGEGDLDLAEHRFEEALRLFREGGEREWEALTLGKLSELAHGGGDHDAAAAHLSTALAINRELGDQLGEIHTLRDFGHLTLESGKTDQGVRHLEIALELARDLGVRAEEANILLLLSQFARYSGDHAAAVAHLQGALRLYEGEGDRRGKAAVLCSLGALIVELGELEEGSTHLTTALQLSRESQDRSIEANALLWLGVSARRSGNREAETFLWEALNLFREMQERRGQANALLELGALALSSTDLEGAAAYVKKSLELSRDIGDLLGEANAVAAIGFLDAYFDPETIASHAEEALGLYRQAGNRLGEANSLQKLGALALELGDLDSSAAHLENAMRLYHEIKYVQGEADARLSLSSLASEQGDENGSAAHAERALALYRQAKYGFGEASALVQLGLQAFKRGRFDRATTHYQDALARFEQIEERVGVGISLSLLGLVSAAQAELSVTPGTQRDHLRAALDLMLDAVRGLETLRTSQSSTEARAGFYRRVRTAYLAALRVAAELDDGRAALEVTEAARADGVASVLRQGPIEVGSEIGELLARIRVVEAAAAEHDPFTLVTTGEMRGVAPEKTAARRLRSSNELQILYRRLRELTSGAFAAAYSPVPATGDPEAVRASLPQGIHALLYEFDETDPDNTPIYCTWLAPHGDPRIRVAVLESHARAVLDRFARRDDTIADEGDPLPYAQLAEALLPVELMAEFEGRSADDPIELLVVPAGPLWALPWSALRLPDGRPLIEAAAITLSPSLGVQSALSIRSPATANPGVLLCLGSHPDLEGGPEHPEAVALRSLFGEAVEEIGPEECVARLAIPPARAHTVLTAVHGQAPEAASVGLDHHVDLGSGLRLRAGDLLNAALAGSFTLGTCFIAAPITRAGDEPLSLPTVALCAGAQSVVAGIFAIPDADTATLLSHYYGKLASGLAPHHALRSAQLAYLRENPPWPPAKWAGLSAIGAGAVS